MPPPRTLTSKGASWIQVGSAFLGALRGLVLPEKDEKVSKLLGRGQFVPLILFIFDRFDHYSLWIETRDSTNDSFPGPLSKHF